jgi:threonine dehydrogenase-like Zn-dependent dehydrogenase
MTDGGTMQAIAVRPGVTGSVHVRQVRRPTLEEVGDGTGVLVRVLRCGVDGTDKEIASGEYGRAPEGDDFLIIGHENLGMVEAVGPKVNDPELQPGSLVVATVRRPGSSIYDQIGSQDFTLDEVYFERGISLLHGFLTEAYVDAARFIVPLPSALRSVGVLLEPLSVAEKGVNQAYEIQRRVKVWRPERAAVVGAGTIGLLAALVLRLRGLDVTVLSRRSGPYLNSELVEAIQARYVSTSSTSIHDAAGRFGPWDLMFEATGASGLAFEAADSLGRNGVLVLAGITSGDRSLGVPADRISREFVLGNKVMVGTVNASRDDFLRGVDDLAKAEAFYPGWLGRLLTTSIRGLGDPEALIYHLMDDREAIKVFVDLERPDG